MWKAAGEFSEKPVLAESMGRDCGLAGAGPGIGSTSQLPSATKLRQRKGGRALGSRRSRFHSVLLVVQKGSLGLISGWRLMKPTCSLLLVHRWRA